MRRKNHETNDELLYIETIGSYSETAAKISKKELLINYIKSAHSRFDWNYLDKQLIINFAEMELKKCLHL